MSLVSTQCHAWEPKHGTCNGQRASTPPFLATMPRKTATELCFLFLLSRLMRGGVQTPPPAAAMAALKILQPALGAAKAVVSTDLRPVLQSAMQGPWQACNLQCGPPGTALWICPPGLPPPPRGGGGPSRPIGPAPPRKLLPKARAPAIGCLHHLHPTQGHAFGVPTPGCLHALGKVLGTTDFGLIGGNLLSQGATCKFSAFLETDNFLSFQHEVDIFD